MSHNEITFFKLGDNFLQGTVTSSTGGAVTNATVTADIVNAAGALVSSGHTLAHVSTGLYEVQISSTVGLSTGVTYRAQVTAVSTLLGNRYSEPYLFVLVDRD